MPDEAVAVAKKRPSGSEKRKMNTLVRLDDELCETGKKLALLRGTSLGELFTGILKPVVEREYGKELDRETERFKGTKPKGSK